MLVCLRCKQPIYRDEFKELDGGKYHTYCHRALITERFERLSDALTADLRTYFRLSGVYRDLARIVIRQLIADYRELSY